LPETIEDKDDLSWSDSTSSIPRARSSSSITLSDTCFIVCESPRLLLGIAGTLLASCLLYWFVAPNVFEANARVALRSTPESVLGIDRGGSGSGSFASGPVQLETVANEFRSEQLAWDVITRLMLYRTTGFSRSFVRRFPGFDPAHASPDARDYLLDEFQQRLTVQSIPHTLVLEIRFRSRDAALSASVVNALIDGYNKQQMDARVLAAGNATSWLDAQLANLKVRMSRDDQQLADFQKKHGILNVSNGFADGKPTEFEHTAALSEVDALGRELVSATTDRILREAEYRAATTGDPEMVLASDQRLQGPGSFGSGLLQQLHARRSELEQEEAQLRIEHGPNFPRVAEIHNQTKDLDLQIKVEDAKLVERFRGAWKTALDRERMVAKSLNETTGAGLQLNEAELKYGVMRQEANASHEVYVRAMQQVEEAGLAAGSHSSTISVIDYARQPAKPVSPNLLVDMAVTLFGSMWVGLGALLLRRSFQGKGVGTTAVIACALLWVVPSHGQAPTPSLTGLPTGVVRIPQSTEKRSVPNAKDAPSVWDNAPGTARTGGPGESSQPAMPVAAPLCAGDLLEITESHTPEFRAVVRVSEAGTVTLALAGEVHVVGMDERGAAHVIETALVDRGMLVHPQVNVLVTAYAGQDVSVLGEVTRPGVYSYTVHHRLLDLISAASGLNSSAGRLVTITHRDDPKTVIPVVLDPAGTEGGDSHNPQLLAGDTIQVSRAGLVYVVGDVVRPGGFPVDPVQTTTVAQALSLAWGPGQNASLAKAVLIRERPGGRTITTLNLKRMLRGLDPDIPVRDRDILFVPDSMAKNLWNRTMESVIQSAAGVSIYAGLVYSQRF
jgi:polysaccharide export outer membrane protein